MPTQEIDPSADSRKIITDLRNARDNAAVKLAEIGGERERLAYLVFTGDVSAIQLLDQLRTQERQFTEVHGDLLAAIAYAERKPGS